MMASAVRAVAANELPRHGSRDRMDLLSSRPFWPIRDGLPAAFPPLCADAKCDVAVIGSGITGACLTWRLTEAGIDTLVLDRREAAHGSTAGNTGLLSYDLDVPLVKLIARYGHPSAERAWRRCRDAIAEIERVVEAASVDCEFQRKPSLQLAATPAHVPRLRREFEARTAAGLDVEWWPRRTIATSSSLPHQAGILSRGAAELDAYRFTYGLLQAAEAKGARVHDRTAVTRWRFRGKGAVLHTSRGTTVRARRVVIASGYEAGAFLRTPGTTLRSTFALVSEPVDAFSGWPPNRCLIWDTGDPYLYLRTTADHRAIIGGYDEPFRDPRARDRLLGAKAAALRRRFRQFFPDLPFEEATAWAGTFGTTEDGLPFIGRHTATPNVWFALGFGGNGTVFSAIAADIITTEMRGRADPDAELFGFGRGSRTAKD